MPYGPPLPDGAPEDDDVERGLLFVCFNASICPQFEVVNGCACDGNLFGLGGDRDFLLGEPNGARTGKMTIQGDAPTFFVTAQPLFVTLRGGEYLYQPGITGLRWLAAAR